MINNEGFILPLIKDEKASNFLFFLRDIHFLGLSNYVGLSCRQTTDS